MFPVNKLFRLSLPCICFLLVISFGCKRDPENTDTIPIQPPAAGCCYFTNDYSLPQTQSLQQLSEYLSSEHFDYTLDGWFFFGSLENSVTPDDPDVFFIAVQRIEEDKGNGFRTPMVPAIVGYNSSKLGYYEFRGFYTYDISPLMTVVPNPWVVTLVSPFPPYDTLIEMKLLSGTMGAADAVYNLHANIPDITLGRKLKADVQIRDRYGTINEGDGTASFFAQYITNEQREEIMNSSERTVTHYLENTGDPMSCQGSYYYSLPLLDVENFTINLCDTVVNQGNGGLMWMDYVVQSYDQRAWEAFDGASWSFYAIQLPQINSALMVIEINSALGSLPIAKLFNLESGSTLNFAHNAKYVWPINEVNIQAVPGSVWTSPKSHLNYATEHRIQLMSADYPADLYITMVRSNQEIFIDKDNIKYEGLAKVTGTLGGVAVEGQAFVEIQPEGQIP